MKGAGRERIVSGRVFRAIVGDVGSQEIIKRLSFILVIFTPAKLFPPPVKLVSFLVVVAFSEKSDIGVTDR